MSLTTAADIAWQIEVTVRGSTPDLTVGDIGWLLSYVVLIGALADVIRRTRRGLDVDGRIDIAVVIVVTMLVQWQFSLNELMTDSSVSLFSRMVWLMYPILDAVLLALVVRLVVTRSLRLDVVVALGVGMVCWLTADFAFALLPSADEAGRWLDAAWVCGALLLASTTWPRTANVEEPSPEAAATMPGLGSIAGSLVPLAVPTVLALVAWITDETMHPVALLVGTVTLLALAWLRVVQVWKISLAATDRIASSERYAQALSLNASDSAAVVDEHGTIIFPGSRIPALCGFDEVDGEGLDVFRRIVEEDREMMSETFHHAVRNPHEMQEVEARFVHRSGEQRWISVRICSLLDDPGVGGIVVNASDITARKEAESELIRQAFHDSLTGLPNRRRFEAQLDGALAERREYATGCTVLFVDVDDFKLVNDSLGHAAGDAVITEVARRLESAVDAGDVVARLGGDEFAILLVRDAALVRAAAHSVAERILRMLTAPLTAGERCLRLRASIGVATADGRETDSSVVLRDANVAMHRAKTTGKGRWIDHDPAMRESAVEQLELEIDLVDAVDNGELRLVYQPIVDLATARIQGVEALVRWCHPTRGDIPPDAFIPLAERNGMILPIGRWVLREACRVAGEWHRAFPSSDPFYVSVNLSARQITNSELARIVVEALHESALPATRLMLEVTETALVRDAVLAARNLRELRELGVRLAIDDFGTGYSSLSYLRQFEVDVLKIDRSFVDTIEVDDRVVPPILSGMMDLARHLELPTIAEGVEREDQRRVLLAAGCTLGQGYYFARPMERDAATAFLGRSGAEKIDPTMSDHALDAPTMSRP